jgi:hypothetical protein
LLLIVMNLGALEAGGVLWAWDTSANPRADRTIIADVRIELVPGWEPSTSFCRNSGRFRRILRAAACRSQPPLVQLTEIYSATNTIRSVKQLQIARRWWPSRLRIWGTITI